MLRRLAEATVDAKIVEAASKDVRRGELRGVGTGEKLPCEIRADLSEADRHQALVVCAEKDGDHILRWAEYRRERRTEGCERAEEDGLEGDSGEWEEFVPEEDDRPQEGDESWDPGDDDIPDLAGGYDDLSEGADEAEGVPVN